MSEAALSLGDLGGLYDTQEQGNRLTMEELENEMSLSEDEITAKFVGQQDLGDPGLESTRARFALADADTAQEKINAFRNIFPEGDIQVTPVTGELVFREDPSQPFAKVDAGLLEKFEPVNDIVDFLGSDIGSIIGELALSKGTGSLLGFLTRMFVGGSSGELAQQGVQTLRGVQEQSPVEVAKQAGEQGALSIIGGGIGRGVGAAVDVARGGAAVSLKPGAEEAISAGNRLGIKRNLTVGEATDVPILQKIEGQSGASLPTVQRYIDARNKELTGIITGITSPAESKKLIRTLAIQEARAKGDILGVLGKSTPRTKLTEGGEALTNGIADYSVTSSRRVTQAFEHARGIEEPTFNITKLKSEVDAITAGKQFKTLDGIKQRAGTKIDSDVADIAKQIKAADPSLPTVDIGLPTEATAVDQLRAWRSSLWDAKTPAKGEPFREVHRAANNLYKKIDAVLKDPTNTSKEFRDSYKLANNMAADRFSTLEKLLIMRTARDESSDQLARTLGMPFNAANLNVLRGTIPSKHFAKFQDSFKLNLLENSGDITNRLKSFDKETLDILLSREEQSLYRKIGSGIDKLNLLDIDGTVLRQTKVGSAVNELINRGDTASIDLLADLVERSGGKSGELGTQLRAGILQHFSDRVLVKEGGATRLAANKMTDVITDIRESGLGRFLTPTDMSLFANLDEFLPLIRTVTDTGTSMQAGEAAAGSRGAVAGLLTGQPVSGAAFQTIIEHLGVGILFTKYAHTLRGLGKSSKKSTKALLGRLGAILNLAGNEKQAFNPEDLEKLEIITGAR